MSVDPASATRRVLRASGLQFSAWEAGEGPLVLCLQLARDDFAFSIKRGPMR